MSHSSHSRAAPTLEDLRGATSSSSSSSVASASSRRSTFVVSLGPVGYRVAWLGIYLFHAMCALYCFGAAMLFHVTRETFMVTYFTAYDTILAPRFFPILAITHGLFGAVHACFLVAPVVRGLYRVLPHRNHTGPSRTDSVLRFASVLLPQRIEQQLPQALRRASLVVYTRVLSRHGLLGIESRHFDRLQLARELVECALQAVQAYHMSHALSRPWLNRLFAATLIANCWITPLIHIFVKDAPLRRLLDRLFDVVLDFLASVGVPLALVVSYGPHFDPATLDFPTELWYDDVWAVRLRTESALVFFGSWVDALCRLTFSLGLLLSLDDIKILLTHRRVGPAAVKPHTATSAKPRPFSAETIRGARSKTLVPRLGHGVLVGFGLALLSVHLYAELLPHPLACLLELRPWLVTQPTCAIVEFSCFANRHFTGDARDFDRVFQHLNPGPLVQVSVRHCPALDVQPSIQSFPNLWSLTFYNTTIRSWLEQAALTNASHPALLSLAVLRTTFLNGSLPDGLLSLDFPRSLLDVTLSMTNLESLPTDLDVRWPSEMVLCLEFSPLDTYPSAFLRLQALALMLAGNQLTHVPAAAFEAPGLFMLGLSGNPITSVPDDVDPTLVGGLYAILLDSTNVSALPSWLVETAATGTLYVAAGRTPFCESLAIVDDETRSGSESALGDETSSSASFDDTPSSSFWSIDCTDSGPAFGAIWRADEERASEVW